ncbi:hypothetical protein AXF42_Ash013988 [Apostasia shenzhenica]|uniref:Uncharacterized protein n=1 Tax=Apostasia shenzhenica TaxID=1088818 RepID=A0A2I0A931_9ASPA|nr:hypothetical protein AXF42_Ash013988 [Apostasia shenzhenica]
MVARTCRINSVAYSAQAGEPSVRAPGDGVSASTSRHCTESASNLTDLVTSLTAQQAVILMQTQLVCAAMLPPPLDMEAPATLPPVAEAPIPPPQVAEALAPLPSVAAPSAQSSASSQLPRRLFPPREVHQNYPPLHPLPAFLPHTCPPFLARRDPLFPGVQAPRYGPDPFFSPMDSNAPLAKLSLGFFYGKPLV